MLHIYRKKILLMKCIKIKFPLLFVVIHLKVQKLTLSPHLVGYINWTDLNYVFRLSQTR